MSDGRRLRWASISRADENDSERAPGKHTGFIIVIIIVISAISSIIIIIIIISTTHQNSSALINSLPRLSLACLPACSPSRTSFRWGGSPRDRVAVPALAPHPSCGRGGRGGGEQPSEDAAFSELGIVCHHHHRHHHRRHHHHHHYQIIVIIIIIIIVIIIIITWVGLDHDLVDGR
jgi:hypothetical protein